MRFALLCGVVALRFFLGSGMKRVNHLSLRMAKCTPNSWRICWPVDWESLEARLGGFARWQRAHESYPQVTPMSCGGCPYNSFRSLDEKPGGAIGCSSIRAIPAYDNGVLYIPTMGAGGSIYSGWAPFNGNRHIFQYLGDGSYFHSGRGPSKAA